MRFNADLRVKVHGCPGIFLHFLPEVEVEPGEGFKCKGAVEARRHVGGDGGRFNCDRAGAAEGVNEGLLRGPS